MRPRRVVCFAAALALAGPHPALSQTPAPPQGLLAVPPLLLELPPSAARPLPGDLSLGQVIQRALTGNANLLVQAQQVRFNQGAVQEARGVYDPVIVGRASQENGPKPMRSGDTAALAVAGSQALHVDQNSTTSYGLGVEQTLGSGAHIESGFSVGSTKSEYNVLQGIPTQTTGSIRFGVRYPLQRNANGIEQSSALAASELERDASNEDLLQISATTVLNVVQTYWEIAARVRRLEILRESEVRAGELLAELRKLVDADHIPAAELNLAQASEAEKRAARLSEEQLLQQAWGALARLTLADAGDVFAALPVTEPLPELNEQMALAATWLPTQRDAVLERRPDLRAARLRERAALLLMHAAQDKLRPQVDLVAGASSNALAEGSQAFRVADALGRNIVGPTINVGVEMRWPYRNDAAAGLFLARSAARDQATIRLRDLEGAVGPSLASAVNALLRTKLRYHETESATRRYAISVQNERTKRRLGLSTLIDVINLQDRLDSAQLALLSLRQEYATLLAQLEFDAGTLVNRGNQIFTVDIDKLQGRQRKAP